MSLIHLQQLLKKGYIFRDNIILPTGGQPVFQTPLVEEAILPSKAFRSFVKYELVVAIYALAKPFILFHWSIYLFCFCKLHPGFIITSL